MNRNIIILSALMLPLSLKGYGSTARSSIAADSLTEKALLRTDSLATDSASTTGLSGSLGAVTVRRRRPSMIRQSGAVNGITMGRDELFKAACCNLGESFTTNPAVDVSYSDATTGAKQIKLLGLSGKYVQLLTENIPDFRGAAQPYSLDYIPGPWLKSIDVSKGAASVKNGYESITGQINAGYLLPQDPEGVSANLYANTMSRMEANFDGNIHLSSRLSTEVLGHYQYNPAHFDHNDDGFLDDPNTRQYNVQNRWAYFSPLYIFHGGLSLINEDRSSGQKPGLRLPEGVERYTTDINTTSTAGWRFWATSPSWPALRSISRTRASATRATMSMRRTSRRSSSTRQNSPPTTASLPALVTPTTISASSTTSAPRAIRPTAPATTSARMSTAAMHSTPTTTMAR